MIFLIFKVIALFFFMMFISFVLKLIITVFKVGRRVKEQQSHHQGGAQKNYASGQQSGKQDIDAEYRVVDKD
ncbi:MAG: hypothetical protein KAG61_06920 [Bacteriovoracaceae bacterium]|nr:hypothetical protein [Bacteriovoracaceae bacterium]